MSKIQIDKAAAAAAVAQSSGVSAMSVGAIPDGVLYKDGAITAASVTLVCAGGAFSQADVGKPISVRGAGVPLGRPFPLYRADGAMTSGSAVLTSATGKFAAGDVGKAITVYGAGPADVPLDTTILSVQSATQATLSDNASTALTFAPYTYTSYMDADLTTTIASVASATQVTLSAPAGKTVMNAFVSYGTDNQAAFSAAMTAADTSGVGRIFIPAGTYYCGSSVRMVSGVSIGGVMPKCDTEGKIEEDEWDLRESRTYAMANRGGTVVIGPSSLEAFSYESVAGTPGFLTGVDFGNIGADGIKSIFRVGAVDREGSAWCRIHNVAVFNNRGGYAIDVCNSQHTNIDFVRVINAAGSLAWRALYRTTVSKSSGNSGIYDFVASQGGEGDEFPGILGLADGNQVAGPWFFAVQNNRLQCSLAGRAIPNVWFLGTLRTESSIIQGLLLSGPDIEGHCLNNLRIDQARVCKIEVENFDTGNAVAANVFIKKCGNCKFDSILFVTVWYDGGGNNMWFGHVQSWASQKMQGFYTIGNGGFSSMVGVPTYGEMKFDYGILDMSLGIGLAVKGRIQNHSDATTLDKFSAGLVRLTGTGTYTISLDAPANTTGLIFTFKKEGASGTVTISASSIEGGTTKTMSTQWGTLRLQSNGTTYLEV